MCPSLPRRPAAIAFFCAALLWPAAHGQPRAETVTPASGEVGALGTVTSGAFGSTAAADGDTEKLAESKDAGGDYGIEWQWSFAPPPAASYRLRIRAQATNSKHGMDFYEFRLPDGTLLGTVDATTMSDYEFAIADGKITGPVSVHVRDTNRAGDTRRSNQLWIDQLVIVGEGAPPTELGAPSDLTASAGAGGSIVLGWTDNATAEDSFEVHRGDDGTTFALLATPGANATGYTDAAVAPGATHYYRVRARQGATVSEWSNIAVATAGSGGGGGTGPLTDKAIIAYYPSWAIYNARKYFVSHIPFDTVTHINYAFANIDPATGTVIVGDSFAEETNRKDPETDDGLPAGNLHQLTYYRDFGHEGPAQAHLKVLISIGGWTWSENFSDIALTPESRGIFARSVRDFVAQFDLDGADIDWEFPTGDPADCGEPGNICRAVDPVNHALLLLAIRAKLDELGPGKELTVALPADPVKIGRFLPPMVDNGRLVGGNGQPLPVMVDPDSGADVPLGAPTAVDALTRINVMVYDLAGASWLTETRHHAPLYAYPGDPAEETPAENLTRFNAHYAMQAYRFVHQDYATAGFDPDADVQTGHLAEIPAQKLVLGLPLYGRGFDSVDAGDYDGYPGLFQFTDDSARRRVPRGTYDGGKWGNTGVFAYWDILLNLGGNVDQPGQALHAVEPVLGEPYGPYVLLGDLFIGFDDLVQVGAKVEYVEQHGFGGIMVWDLPSDLSPVQVAQGVPGAAAAYPAKSLMKRIAQRLEDAFLQR